MGQRDGSAVKVLVTKLAHLRSIAVWEPYGGRREPSSKNYCLAMAHIFLPPFYKINEHM